MTIVEGREIVGRITGEHENQLVLIDREGHQQLIPLLNIESVSIVGQPPGISPTALCFVRPDGSEIVDEILQGDVFMVEAEVAEGSELPNELTVTLSWASSETQDVVLRRSEDGGSKYRSGTLRIAVGDERPGGSGP